MKGRIILEDGLIYQREGSACSRRQSSGMFSLMTRRTAPITDTTYRHGRPSPIPADGCFPAIDPGNHRRRSGFALYSTFADMGVFDRTGRPVPLVAAPSTGMPAARISACL